MKEKIKSSKTAAAGVEFLKMDGLTKADPAMMGGSAAGDPWVDRAHDGIKKYRPGPGAKAILMTDQIPGLDQTKTENFKPVVGFYDPVRDVQPSTPSAPAPLSIAPRDPTKVKVQRDPWVDMADNGQEVYPASVEVTEEGEENGEEQVRRLIPKLVQNFQEAPSVVPMKPVNINTIGSAQEKESDEEEQPLRKPTEIDQHIVTNHFIEINPTFFPIEEVKDLHLELHASGQAADHNPEVLKVAGLEHILGNKEEELNFLPKIAELITFPPEPGEEENWMFPYDIKERFVESPRNRRGQ